MVRMDFHGGEGESVSAGNRFGLSLVFLLFLTMGSLFELFVVREFARALGQRSWKKTPCRIVHSAVQERSGSASPFAFVVSYQYEHGGRTYAGSVYKRTYTASEEFSRAQRLARRFPPGLETSCYVNPGNPTEAVLARQTLLIGLVILFPLIFVVIGAGGIYFTWRKRPAAEARPIAAIALRKSGKSKYAVAPLFVVFAIVGATLLYPLGIKPIAKTIEAESWTPTPCKVLRAEVRSHDGEDGTTYSVYILYEYEFGGRTYKSDRYEFVGGSSSGYKSKARVVAAYESAASPLCYVDPKAPSEAVLQRGFRPKLLLALFPLPFLLIGIGGVIHTLRGKPAAQTKAAEPWMPASRPVVPADVADTGILRPSETGPVVLTPKFPARMKCLAVTFLALFWNGILSIFVISAVNELRHGQAPGFQNLMLLPFLAVGVALIAYAIYQFLATFNPVPTLELSSATIPLGGAAELRWRFSGRTDRIAQFTVTLRGIEEARYRRGTSTYTDRNTFYAMELYKTSAPNEITSGQVGFLVPSETMHSFEAENNKILWSLAVHGDIRNWPDVKDAFNITVAPAAV